MHEPHDTNILPEEWALKDDVMRLQAWGTDRVYSLHADHHPSPVIGSAPTCAIQSKTERAARRASTRSSSVSRAAGW